MKEIKGYKNPKDEGHGSKYHTGKKCIEKDCNNHAGTRWSPYWCKECNIKRMDNITKNFEEFANYLGEKE